MDKAEERGRCTVTVIGALHILVAILYSVLLHCIIDSVEVWTGQGVALPDAVYGRALYWTEHEIGFARDMAKLFSQNFYNVSLVVDSTYYERSILFLRGELLKTLFNHNVIFVVPHHGPTVICKIKSTLEKTKVEVNWVDNLYQVADRCVSQVMG